MPWWPCKRSLQRVDDLLAGRKDPEALFLRLHVRFCAHCKPWYRHEKAVEQGLRSKTSPPFPGAERLLERVRAAGEDT
jgi:hypothetical protein